MAGFPRDTLTVRTNGSAARTSRMPHRSSCDPAEQTAVRTRTASKDSYYQLVTALLLLAQGNIPLACEYLHAARQLARRHEDDHLLYLCMTAEAALAHKQGDVKSMQSSLARAEALAPASAGPVMELPHRRLAAIAVSASSETWPRAIRITTLGCFGIAVRNVPLDLSAICQKKPLELLRALIALGGREVPITRLYEALWPEAEGDAAHRNFTVALHRLRRLFDVKFITLRDGRLGLDPGQCEVDLWTLECNICALDRLLAGNDPDRWTGVQEKLIALDHRPFLENEDAAWAFPAREHLREKCLRILAGAARAFSRAGRHAEAIHCGQLGIHIEPLAEELHRILMSSHHAQGESSTALAAYHQCRAALQHGLGVAPSRVTEALYREISAVTESSA